MKKLDDHREHSRRGDLISAICFTLLLAGHTVLLYPRLLEPVSLPLSRLDRRSVMLQVTLLLGTVCFWYRYLSYDKKYPGTKKNMNDHEEEQNHE